MIKIPTNNKKFSQTNESDVSGNIYITKNIDFDEKSVIKLAPRTISIFDEDDDADIGGAVVDMEYLNQENQIFIAGTGGFFQTPTLFRPSNLLSVAQNSETGVPTADAAGVTTITTWNADANIGINTAYYYRWDGNWDNISISISADISCVFKNLNQLLIMGSGVGATYTATLYNTTGTAQNSLNVSDVFVPICVTWNNNRAFIGTRHSDDENHCLIYEWDGLSSSANNAYMINAHSVFSVTPYLDGVLALTSSGEYIYISGGKQTIVKLPVFYNDKPWVAIASFSNSGRKVTSKGMKNINNRVYTALSSRIERYTDDDREERFTNTFPGGVWCYDENVGLYNKYTLSSSRLAKTSDIATTSVNTTTNVITVSGATVPNTGTPCFYYADGATEITGLQEAGKYYVIKDSGTTLRLAETYTDAIADTEIDITGTGNNAQYLVFAPNSDFGGTANIGTAITYVPPINSYLMDTKISNGFVIAGVVSKETDVSVSTTTINTVAPGLENRGYFITPRIESAEIEDIYNSIVIKWKKFQDESDKILIKFRTNISNDDISGLNINSPYVTWVDSTSFTTTEDLSNIMVGDEVEFVSGAGAGYLAHISSLTNNSGTWTVVIDESVQNISANDRAAALYCRWTKLGTVGYADPENSQGYKQFTVNKKGKWIQFKIELRGIGTTIEELIINNQPYKRVKD